MDEPLDTPTHRVSINQMKADELDVWLDEIRRRRLHVVAALEQAAKVKADDVRLSLFLKFQNQYNRAMRAIQKLDEQLVKTEAAVHKARLLALAAEMEVGQEEEEKEYADC